MSEAVVVALCSFAATLLTGLGGYQLIAYRVEQLEKKVEKHNNLVERMALVEASAKSAHKRLDELHEEKE